MKLSKARLAHLLALIPAALEVFAMPAGCTKPAIEQPPPSPAAATIAPVDDQAARAAIRKGAAYLLSVRDANGTWCRPEGNVDDRVTDTAMAMLALASSETLTETRQDLEKSVGFLANTPTDGTAVLGLRCLTWKAGTAGFRGKYRQHMRGDARKLVLGMGRMGQYGPVCDPCNPPTQTDNVSSACGSLGVWAAMEADEEVPREYWYRVLHHWIHSRCADGGWGLTGGSPSTAMTTAGGLAVFQACFDTLATDAFIRCKGDPNVLMPLDRAAAWLGRYLPAAVADPNGKLGGADDLYSLLYFVQQAGEVTGRKFFGEEDWYALGTAVLLASQKPDGSWEGKHGAITATAQAVLFLASGQEPRTICKLQHRGDWNNRPRDIANLAKVLSGLLCWRPVGWEIVPITAPVESWHDAPVLYIGGAEGPNFSAEDIRTLREYVNQGGTIFSVRQCDGKGFGDGMRRAYEEMFPKYVLRAIDANHKMYNINFKLKPRAGLFELTNGVRTLAIHSDIDLSKSWQLRLRSTAKEDFELPFNALLYVTDGNLSIMERRPHCGWLPEPAKAPARTIRVARLRYEGNWDPEPLAWTRFGRLLTEKQSIGVNAEPVDIVKLPGCGAKIAHLTGTDPIVLSRDQMVALKKFVTAGGTLLVDAAGGPRPFAGSDQFGRFAETLLQYVFLPTSLRRLETDSPLYNLPGMKIEEVKYSRGYALLYGMRPARPELKAITIDGRAAVIFSEIDITAALLGVSPTGRAGYQPESAYELVRNVLLYAEGER